jgi:hypothetical protein
MWAFLSLFFIFIMIGPGEFASAPGIRCTATMSRSSTSTPPSLSTLFRHQQFSLLLIPSHHTF